jgi:NTE family protein
VAASANGHAHAPELLVLGGGGVLGEAWMAATLAGLQEAGGFDARRCGGYIGTSAGSIVAAALAGGVAPRERLKQIEREPVRARAQRAGREPTLPQALELLAGVGRAATAAAAAPAIALGLRFAEPAGALLRRTALARMRAGRWSLAELGRAIDRLGLSWDGRLLIAAVDVASGRRVMFGARGAREASVSQAVQASCAIPGICRPVCIGERTYVDGGVWSPTNMDAAGVGREARVLCLNPTGSLRAPLPIGILTAVSRSLAAGEALALRRRGARVTVVNPDRASSLAMGANLLDSGPRPDVIAAGLAQGRRLAAALAQRRI